MCSWTLTPLHAAEVTLEQVVARHTAAVGGREAVERVRSVQYAVTIVEPTFTVDGIYRADRVKKALHPDADPTEKPFETRYSDFREVDGVPFR
jgi:hypothetical protein